MPASAFISLIHSRRHISLTTLSRPRIAISGADIRDRRRTYHESFIRPARDRAARIGDSSGATGATTERRSRTFATTRCDCFSDEGREAAIVAYVVARSDDSEIGIGPPVFTASMNDASSFRCPLSIVPIERWDFGFPPRQISDRAKLSSFATVP